MNKFRLLIAVVTLVAYSTMSAQITTVQIGQSKYDLQTNNSIERRIVVDPTTKNLTATYTGSNAVDGTFTDRGTGYAFFDGTDWKNAQGTTMTTPITAYPTRPETVRIGWPNPVYVGNKEIIISHQSTGGSNGLWIISRPNKGTGAWTENKSLTSGPETWPRVAQDGNKIVVISSVFETTFNGVTGGIQIMKSSDAGVTWSNPDTITGINIENYPNGIGGDLYALDLKGNTIAILTGRYDISLYKSTDFGTTFTKTSLIPTSINTDVNNKAFVEAADRSDGSFSVLIDNNSKIHCFWGREVTYSGYDQNSVYGLYIDKFKSGIMYWNENMTTAVKPVVIPQTTFIRENANSPSTLTERFNQTNNTGSNIDYNGSNSGYNSNTTTWPSSGIDANGTIYLTYGYNRGIIDTTNHGIGIDADSKGANLYDIYVVKSTDGINWTGPINVSNTATGESSYPSMARFVDDNVHIVWQEDILYGNAISTTAGGSNGTGSQIGTYTDNKIMYAKVPVVDIVSPVVDITPPVLQFKSGIDHRDSSVIEDSLFFQVFKGCSKDIITGNSLILSKPYFLSNYIDFYDDVDGRDTTKVTFSDFSTINMNTVGVYNVKVFGVDAAGNSSKRGRIITPNGILLTNISIDTINIIIEVLPATADVEAPKVTLFGNDKEYVYIGDPYTDAGVNVTDNNPCSSVNPVPSGTINVNTIGTYTKTYTATDLAGNVGSATRTIYVGKEATPIITNESIVDNKVTASSSTSLNNESFSNPVYAWKGKVAGSTTSFSLSNKDNLSNFTVSKKMDSLCLSISNEFQKRKNKTPLLTCVELKFAGSAINSVDGKSFTISVVPNPNLGIFKLKIEGLNKMGNAVITIANTEGKVMNRMSIDLKGNDEIPFDFSNFSKGTYFIHTQIDNEEVVNRFEIK